MARLWWLSDLFFAWLGVFFIAFIGLLMAGAAWSDASQAAISLLPAMLYAGVAAPMLSAQHNPITILLLGIVVIAIILTLVVFYLIQPRAGRVVALIAIWFGYIAAWTYALTPSL